MALLLLNAGSSTLKFSLVDPNERRVSVHGMVDAARQPAQYEWRTANGESSAEDVAWDRVLPAVERIVSDARRLADAEPEAGAIEAVVMMRAATACLRREDLAANAGQ